MFFLRKLIKLAYLLQTFKFLKFSSEEETIIKKLEKLILEKFNCQIDIKRMIINKIRSWVGIYPLMKYFLRLKNLKFSS